MEISSLIMEIMREKNIMRDRKWNFPPCFCIIRDGKCQKQGRKITFLGIFFSKAMKKNAKTGKEFGIEGKKDINKGLSFETHFLWCHNLDDAHFYNSV